MNYYKKYLQFNELVFDNFDMISEYDEESTDFKYEEQEYSHYHGNYVPFKSSAGLARAKNVSLTLKLKMKKMPCDQRKNYAKFVISELMKQGKLWAVENDTLLWAYAYVSSMSKLINDDEDTLEISVDFSLYEGVWHKADLYSTYIIPYDACTFMYCYNYIDVRKAYKDIDCSCCECADIEKKQAIWYNNSKLQELYADCGNTVKIVYDCNLAYKYFGNDSLGQKICKNTSIEYKQEYFCGTPLVGTNDSIIAGELYSDTDLPTSNIDITIPLKVHDTIITINNNTNIINGDYDGLIIEKSGDIYSMSADKKCKILLSPSLIDIPNGNTYGFTIKPRYNSVIVDTGVCRSSGCIYIKTDDITV